MQLERLTSELTTPTKVSKYEDSLRKDSLAKKLLCKHDKEFWKEIKRMRSKVSLPNVIDGV